MVLAALGALALTGLALSIPKGVSVKRSDLALATVSAGEFLDEVLVRAQAQSARRVMLDAVNGGRVEEVMVHDVDALKAGAMLFRLSNPQSEQELLQRSAEMAQQLSNLSMQRTAFAQARAQLRRDLAQQEFDAANARNQWQRQSQLFEQAFVSKAVVQDAALNLQLRQNLLEHARTDGQAEMHTREQAIADMERAIAGLQAGMAVLRKSAADLTAKAPSDGVLSGFNLQVGTSVRAGDNLGRIDDVGNFKMVAQVDEFYLHRIQPGLPAHMSVGGTRYALRVSKHSPEIKDGRFSVDLAFTQGQPKDLHAGLSIDVGVQLGQSSHALLLADGAFYGDSGGAWVYVLNAAGDSAERRSVRLGRRAAGRIEVLDGLRVGEQVVISKVRQFGDAKFLSIRNT